MDPYDEYMSGATGAASGAAAGTSVLPGWGTAVGAGVGLLSSLYGNYKAQDTADKNYKNQLREFERQRAIEEEQLARSRDAARLAAMYAAKSSVDSDQDRLLSRYAGYYKGIGR